MGSSINCNFVAFLEKPMVEDAWAQVTTPISLFFTYLGGGNAWDPVSLAISVLFVKNRRGDAWDKVTTQIFFFCKHLIAGSHWVMGFGLSKVWI